MRMTPRELAFDVWKRDAANADLPALIMGRGHRLSRSGAEWVGPCPACGGRDRFSIDPRKRVFNCRGYGGGDYIAAIQHIDDCDFVAACETLTGEPAPGRSDAERPSRPSPRLRAPGVASVRIAGTEGDDPRAVQMLSRGSPIAGTHAEAYFRARGLTVSPYWTGDLRFVEAYPYHGYSSDLSDEQEPLGSFPAILAPIRNGAGHVIGVHRTYLDPQRPDKLSPPGDASRNVAKKVWGKAGGGHIRLSPPSPVLVIGEGIETTAAYYTLNPDGGDYGLAAAYSLNNLAGSSLSHVPHPTIPRRKIPDGRPDMDRPGVILPAGVDEVVLLGDGDSDAPTTYAHMLCAARRFEAIGVRVLVAMAPAGMDWNDVLVARDGAA